VSGERGPWYWSRLLGTILLVMVVVAAAARRADRQGVGTDFHVFWQAGYNFAHGLSLYQPLPGARHFKYPPFAAQAFQLLGLFPLKTAARLFYVASVGLILLAVWLTQDIGRKLEPARPPGRRPLVLSIAVSAVFMLDNLVHVQANLLTLVLCLLGIRAFVNGREGAAGGWLVAATAIKITPIFFLVWATIRGSLRAVASLVAFGAACLSLPVLQRGFAQGITDLTDYYQTFLHQFASGEVVASFRNQNLAAMIYRAFIPSASGDVYPYDYAYLPSQAAAAPLVYRVIALLVLAIFVAYLIRRRTTRQPIGVLEICSVFLASHLMSGITLKAHLVTLLFVSYAFFSLDARLIDRRWRWALWAAWGGLVTIGLGRDLIGSKLHHYMAGYSLYVWVMLLLFTLSLVWGEPRVRSEG
jgi:Glycosyltransferase family 87